MAELDDDDFDNILDDVQKLADEKLAKTLAIPPDLLKSICPVPADEKRLRELMQAVQQATSDNEAHKKLVEQLESCGTVVVRLLRKLVFA